MYRENPQLEYRNYLLWHARQALGRHAMTFSEWQAHRKACKPLDEPQQVRIAFAEQQAD